MKFFTKYSFLVNTFFIVTVITGVLYIGSRALEGGSDPNELSSTSCVELTAFNFHYKSYDENGKMTTNSIFKKLEKYVNQDVKLVGIFEKNYNVKNGNETWNVKSHCGFSQNKNSNLIHLYDGVNFIMFANSDNNFSPDQINIKSSEMYYNSENYNFYNNNKFVKIYDPKTGNNTTGIGVEGNFETKVVNIKEDVRSYYASS